MTKAAKAIVAHTDEPKELAPVQQQGDAIIQMIERAARDPQVDIEKMERLFAMRERMQQQQAVAAFNAAMAAVQAELVPVVARSVNDQTRSKYAKLDAIAEAAGPVIHKHGFGTSFGTFKSEIADHQGITVKVMHAGGHSEAFQYDVPTDAVGMRGNANKTKTHAYGSTLTYGRRYAKLMAFDIATTEDDDGQAAGEPEYITDEQQSVIRDKIDELGADIEKFCAYFEIDGIAKIPAKHFQKAMDALNAKARARP